MLSEFSPFEPVVEKEGVLSKLGGGAGGHKNWKDRYFVLADHLYYYNSKAEFVSDPQSPLGRVNLLSFFVSKSDPATHEFCVHSYPKSLTCRASSKEELDEWVDAIMKPLEALGRVNVGGGTEGSSAKAAKVGGGGGRGGKE